MFDPGSNGDGAGGSDAISCCEPEKGDDPGLRCLSFPAVQSALMPKPHGLISEDRLIAGTRTRAWYDKKIYDKAIADYNEAIRLDPQYAAAYNNRGNAWVDKNEYEKAIADFSEAIRLDPQYAIAYNGRATAWYAKGANDKAIADCNEAIRLDPQYALAYNNRGVAWYRKTEYGKAIADYNEAIRLDPKDALAYNGRSWLWATCPDANYRDGKRAIESATKACELTVWEDAYPVGALAAACAEAGDFDAVMKWQTKANGLYSDAGDKKKGESRLKLYQEKKPYHE